MARNHREVQPDLAWLDRLPGIKVLSPGNHDGWWNVVAKIRPLLRKSMLAVEGDALEVNDVIVCGTRGAAATDDDTSTSASLEREVTKLRSALDAANRLRGIEPKPVFVLWHYPPFDSRGAPGPVVELLESANATACVYGHLHTQAQWETAVQGTRGATLYRCVAADALGFRPLRIR
jgi:predicted phosphohydrolase